MRKITGILLLRLSSGNYFVIFSIQNLTRLRQRASSNSNQEKKERKPELHAVQGRDAKNSSYLLKYYKLHPQCSIGSSGHLE